MATTVTAAQHFMWRHLYASMQAAQTPASKPLFWASLRCCAQYCTDRDTVQKKNPRFTHFFGETVHNSLRLLGRAMLGPLVVAAIN